MSVKHSTRLLLLLFCALIAGRAQALEIGDIRFGVYEGKTRMVLDLDSPADFRTYTLSDPVRLVIDLPAFSWSAGAVEQPENAGVLAVRHGVLDGGTGRIVFDLNRPIAIQNAFTLPSGKNKPDRLVIDFTNVSNSIFQGTKSKTYGSLGAIAEKTGSASGSKPEPRPEPPVEPAPQTPRNRDKKPLVVIDPGHGGIDPGALGAGLKEKNVVLGLAKALRNELERSGDYRVLMTRETDIFIPLAERVKFSRNHAADLFVSIHADSISDPGVGGASIYTLSETASDAQTAKLAARENKVDLIAGIDLSVEDQDVANILVDLAMRDTMNQSKFFATKLVNTLPNQGVRLLERPHRYAGFAVLKAPDIPSVLVEAGFMSNNTEAKRLNSSEHRSRFAKALHRGIDAYFAQLRKNTRN